MPRISIENRKEIVRLHKTGLSNREIGRRINCNEKTVRKIVKKHQETGSVSDAPKSGRPRALSEREVRHVKIRSLRNRFETASQIRKECNLVEKCSISTIKRRLTDFELRGCIARRKPLISTKNKKARMNFVRSHEDHDASYTGGRCFLATKASSID